VILPKYYLENDKNGRRDKFSIENKSTSISFEERFHRQRELTTSPIISDHGKIVTNDAVF